MTGQKPELNRTLIKPGSHILAGCSGGADSLCMTELLWRLKTEVPFTLSMIHVHHGLRENADRDAEEVKKYCESRGIPCMVKAVSVKERVGETGESTEEAARILRYRAMFETAAEIGADTVAVAHQAEDQAETVLFQMLRGSGLRGLSGMESERVDTASDIRLIRPLLQVPRRTIREFLTNENIAWCEDETNEADIATRNRIRHHVLPELEKVRPDAVQKIVKTAAYLKEADGYFREQAEKWCRSHAGFKEEGILLPAEEFLKEHPLVQEYIAACCLRASGCGMKDKGRIHLDAVLKLFSGAVGRELKLPDDGYAVRTYEGVLIRKEKAVPHTEKEEHGNSGKDFEKRIIPYEKTMNFPNKEYTKCFDYDKITEDMVLRTRLPGDRFSTAPGTHKKLKDFFIDEKIPREKRDGCLLLASGHEILWVVGYRMSEEYKVTDRTKRILEVTLKGQNGTEGPEEECDEGR